jgi:hypothetical protein
MPIVVEIVDAAYSTTIYSMIINCYEKGRGKMKLLCFSRAMN